MSAVKFIKFLDVAGLLMEKGAVSSTKSANATSLYLIQWSEGCSFDLSSRAFQMHRARLRKIGIDIAKPYVDSQPDFGNIVFKTNWKYSD